MDLYSLVKANNTYLSWVSTCTIMTYLYPSFIICQNYSAFMLLISSTGPAHNTVQKRIPLVSMTILQYRLRHLLLGVNSFHILAHFQRDPLVKDDLEEKGKILKRSNRIKRYTLWFSYGKMKTYLPSTVHATMSIAPATFLMYCLTVFPNCIAVAPTIT